MSVEWINNSIRDCTTSRIRDASSKSNVLLRVLEKHQYNWIKKCAQSAGYEFYQCSFEC